MPFWRMFFLKRSYSFPRKISKLNIFGQFLKSFLTCKNISVLLPVLRGDKFVTDLEENVNPLTPFTKQTPFSKITFLCRIK